MNAVDGPIWGMHLFWWAFWIVMMVSVFGFNVPERTRVNSLDPDLILKRRFAKGEISEEQYKNIARQLRADEGVVRQETVSLAAPTKVTGHPIVHGLSLSATWALFYSMCAVLYFIAPAAVMSATSKLFHGMSFTQMAETGSAFTFSDFISVLTIGAVYAFSAGIFWSLINSYFLRHSAERKLRRLENLTLRPDGV